MRASIRTGSPAAKGRLILAIKFDLLAHRRLFDVDVTLLPGWLHVADSTLVE